MQTRFVSRSFITGLVLAAATLSTAALAQPAQQNVPDHPRVNEVNQRLENQQDRINAGEAKGQMTGAQAAADEKHDANIARRESVDEAKNGGHLTKAEQRHLNKSLNKNSKRVHAQRHPG